MKQNNQSSWAARLRKFSALCLMLVASANLWAQNNLTVKPDIKAGEQGTITIALDNATDYTAFQMEITLPAGLTIEKQTNDYSAMSIVSEVNADHNVLYNQLESGVIKVAAYSFDGVSTGNNAFKASGDFLVITVTAAADYTPADVQINDIIFVTQSDLAAVREGFTVVNQQPEPEVLMGDVDGDGVVKVLDGLAIIDYYLKKDPKPFNVAAADLDGDGEIKVLDALAAIDIYLKKQ